MKTLPLGGETIAFPNAPENGSPINPGFQFSTSSSDQWIQFTDDASENRIAGADDVHVLVFEVADQPFSSDPAVSLQYFVYIVREDSYSVSAAGDDTGIRFIVQHVGIDLDDLTLNSTFPTAATQVTNSGLFEIREITGPERAQQDVPDDLVIYGIFAKGNADLATAVDQDTSAVGTQVDFRVTYTNPIENMTETIDFDGIDIL